MTLFKNTLGFVILLTSILSAEEGSVASLHTVADTTVISTSFDGKDSLVYPIGTISGKQQWTVSGGTGEITQDSAYVHDGTRGLRLSVSAALLDVKHLPYGGSVPGISGIVYFDMYIKVISLATKEFTMVGYDLFGGSAKRTFVVEFSVPAGDSGEIRAYTGSSRPKYGMYRTRSWYRVTGKVDYTKDQYQLSVNGLPPVLAVFRETYTPTASGTRLAGIKEYHQLLFNLGGGTSSGAVGSADVALDSLYVGTVPPKGVSFGSVAGNYTVTVTQPPVGSITLSPAGPSFAESTVVTTKLSVPAGYRNLGWTGDLSGTDSLKTFSITKNMSVGASVGIDSTHPPAKYSVTIQPPDTGSISLSPAAASYYAYTTVTATLTVPSGYKNSGWIGDLSGTELSKQFSMTNNVIIGATVIRDTVITGTGQRKVFTSASAFKTGIANAVPGDTLELVSGMFDIGGITIQKTGTEQQPITIRAQIRGATELTGGSRFTLRQSAYIVIEGFLFTSDGGTVIKGENSHHTRITRNTFRLKETTSGKWVLFGGLYSTGELGTHHNRIDHNLFEEKHQLGNYVTIDGTPDDFPPALSSQFDRIDHNHFRMMGPRAVNEMEAVRLGQSSISATSGFTLVEYNLFEECDGDPEIISVKTNDNTVRYNTFLRSQGTASLRQGNNSLMYGNYFLGKGKPGTGGIRAYGSGHTIFNNYFEGLTGDTWDAALAITNGDVDTGSTSMSAHHRPNRIIVAFNTYVNNANNMQFGFTNNGAYGKPPVNITVANNIIVGSTNQLVKHITQPTSIVYAGNIGFLQGTATTGIPANDTEIRNIDPQLLLTDSVWRLSSGSPAVNAAATGYGFAVADIEGQLRDGSKDVGADEFSAAPRLNRPLRPADVGPNGPDSITVITGVRGSTTLGTVPGHFAVIQNYPNPFNPSTSIYFSIPAKDVPDGAGGSEGARAHLTVINALGQTVATLYDAPAVSGEYRVTFHASHLAGGVYFARLMIGTDSHVTAMVLLK